MSGWASVFRKSSRYRDELVPKEVMHELLRKLIHSGFLVGGMSGEVIACSPISEPETGPNPAEMTTKAEKVEGGCRINGDFPVEQWFRDARVLTIPDGTSEIRKLKHAESLRRGSLRLTRRIARKRLSVHALRFTIHPNQGGSHDVPEPDL